MEQKVLKLVEEKTHELMNAASCCQEAKDAAKAWLAAIGTPDEAKETKNYLHELEEDITTAEGLYAFAGSEMGAKVFGGAEQAKGVAAHAKQLIADGKKYCDCPACKACEAILAEKDAML